MSVVIAYGRRLVDQALHLLKFEFLRAKWLLVSSAVILAVLVFIVCTRMYAVTPMSFSDDDSSLGWSLAWQALVFLLAGLMAVASVQADSPLESQEFWIAHGVEPGALFLSKVFFACVAAVDLPVIAQIAAVLWQRLPLMGALTIIVNPAYWLTSAVVASMLLAAILRGQKSVAMAAMGFGIAKLLTLILLPASATAFLDRTAAIRALNLMILPAMTVVLAWIYCARSAPPARKRVVGATTLLLACLLWRPVDLLHVRPRVVPLADLKTEASSSLQLHEAQFAGGALELMLSIPSPDSGQRAILLNSTIDVHFSDGSTQRAKNLTTNYLRVFQDEAVSPWHPAWRLQDRVSLSVGTQVGWTGNALNTARPVSVELNTIVEMQDAHMRLNTPLANGATAALGHSTFRLLDVKLRRWPRSVILERAAIVASPLLFVDRDTVPVWDGQVVVGVLHADEGTRMNSLTPLEKLTREDGVDQLLLPTRTSHREFYQLPPVSSSDVSPGASESAPRRVVIVEWKYASLTRMNAVLQLPR